MSLSYYISIQVNQFCNSDFFFFFFGKSHLIVSIDGSVCKILVMSSLANPKLLNVYSKIGT